MKAKALIGLLAVSLFLVGCAPIINAMGYVPVADLEAAQEQVASLEQEVANLGEAKEKLETQVSDLEGRLSAANARLTGLESTAHELEEDKDQLSNELVEWQGLLCPQTWDNAMHAFGQFPYDGVKGTDLDKTVFITRWAMQPDTDTGKPYTALLQDVADKTPSMLIDALANCPIINPDFSDLGK